MKTMSSSFFKIFSCCCCILATKNLPAQDKLFQLLSSKDTHINFSNDINESENLNVLAYEYFYNGGGVAVGDINNDGLQDLFFTANMKPNKLYLNLGNLKFKDITKEAGKELEGRKDGWKTGVTMADVNGDGFLDIYICYSGKTTEDARRNQLFINSGHNTFTEEAKKYGLDIPTYSTQAAFFDYDNDGDLDMFLLNHNVKKIDNLELSKYRTSADTLAGNRLFRNDGGHFTDVTQQAGIHQFPLTFGLGIAVADINKDGWQDVYVSNDYNEPDYMYINNGNGTFTDVASKALRHLPEFSMGVDIADLNNDGLPDILSLDMLPEDNHRQKSLQLPENYESFQLMINQDLQKQYMHNMLQLNNGDGTFSEIAQFSGVSNTDWSWCPLMADFDNDGYKDIFISNGYVRDYTNKDFLKYWGDYKVKKAIDREPVLLMDLIKAMPSTLVANYIFKNNHDLTFTNEQQNWGLDQKVLSNGAVYADLDNDGDLDLVINNINSEASVYQNMSVENNHTNYVAVQLKGIAPNTQAIGSKVYVFTKDGVQYEEVNPARGYLSAVSTVLNFGLGKLDKVDSVRIVWPDNKAEIVKDITINKRMVIEQKPATEANDILTAAAAKKYFNKKDNVFAQQREEFDENDFKRQPLMMFMYSQTGPVIAKADVNKDGLDDIFISGDQKEPGKIFTQKTDGSFVAMPGVSIGDENVSAASAAVFFDAKGDGNTDLYLAKGGYSLFQPNTAALQDELYINDGTGKFTLAQNAIPDVSASSKSCVVPCDFDNDGDMDLFVGGRVIPGQYPATPTSYLLVNDGKGKFTSLDVPFAHAGMISSAVWADVNNDGRKDLLMCGEFTPILLYLNTANGFVDATKQYFGNDALNGFWNKITVADVNNDGKPDIIAGNLGTNSQVRATEKEPAVMYYADFDKNGSIDPFLTFYIQGKSYPYVSRDELNDQIYAMRRKFSSYKDYADATITDILSPDEMKAAQTLTVNELRSVCLINKGDHFEKMVLPSQAQFSFVSQILTGDYNHDGKTDVLLFGNHSDNRLKLGSIDANYGCMLLGDGNGNFTYAPQTSSGFCVMGDVKSATILNINKQDCVVVGVHGEGVEVYNPAQ